MQLTWEPITDPVAWAELWSAAERVDRTGEVYTAADLAEELTAAGEGGSILTGVWADGIMVGYAGIRLRVGAGSWLRVDVEGLVRPDARHQGIGSQLLDWAIREAGTHRDAHRPGIPAELVAIGYPDNTPQIRLLESRGFRTRTWEALMQRRIDDSSPPEPPGPVEGFRIGAYAREHSERVRAAHNLAFGTDSTFAAWSAAMWRQWVDDTQAARPELSAVAYDPAGAVASYVIAQEYDGVRELTGLRELYLSKVGTLPEFRGRGLARNLLLRVVAKAAESGFDQVALHADTNNATGAFTLYESAGFQVVRRLQRMVLTSAPGGSGPAAAT
jgi:ribosomal protein S18 acetylase RimI-like enzyme